MKMISSSFEKEESGRDTTREDSKYSEPKMSPKKSPIK